MLVVLFSLFVTKKSNYLLVLLSLIPLFTVYCCLYCFSRIRPWNCFLLFALKRIAAVSFPLLLFPILVFCIADFHKLLIQYSFSHRWFFLLSIGSFFFYYSLLPSYYLFHRFASSSLFWNAHLSFLLSDRNSSVCSLSDASFFLSWLSEFRGFFPTASHSSMPLSLSRTVIQCAVPLALQSELPSF